MQNHTPIKRPQERGFTLNIVIHHIEIGSTDLPKEGINNYRVGKELQDKQPLHHEVDDLKLIDWLDSKGWLIRGAREADSNHLDFAIPCYIRSLELDPNNVQTLHCLGLAYHHKKEYAKAIEHFNKVLFRLPNDVETLYSLANSFLNVDKIEDAIINYKKVIVLNPSHGSAYNNLALAYSLVNQPTLELENMKIAAQLGVDKAINWVTQKGIPFKKVERIIETKNTPEVIL